MQTNERKELALLFSPSSRHSDEIKPSLYSNRIALGPDGDIFLVGPHGYAVHRLSSSGDLSLVFDSIVPVEDVMFDPIGNQILVSDIYGNISAASVETGNVGEELLYQNVHRQQTCSRIAICQSHLYQSDGVNRCLRQFDLATGQLLRTLNCQNSPTDVKMMDFSSDSAIVGIAEQHQITLWDMRQASKRSPIHRFENPRRSQMCSLDSNGQLILAGGEDRALYAFDPRKTAGVINAISGCIKYDITSVISSFEDPDKVFVSGNTDSELVCVDLTQKERSNRFNRNADDNDQASDGDNVFRADSRWLSMARRHKVDGGEELIGLSARYSLYRLTLPDNADNQMLISEEIQQLSR